MYLKIYRRSKERRQLTILKPWVEANILLSYNMIGRTSNRGEYMKPKSEKSIELYNIMVKRGYPEEFCDIVTQNLNTDFTAKRMIGYLAHYKQNLSLEEIADEMLSILTDRNRIMKKKELERVNASWNDFLMNGFEDGKNV